MGISNFKKFYQNSRRPINYVPNVLVNGAPAYAPTMSGLMQINPETKQIWISAGKEFVSDWISIVGGGGTTITLQTNGVENGDQTLLNLRANVSSGIILEDSGSGTVLMELDPSTVKTSLIKTANQVYSAPLAGSWRDISELSFNVFAGKTYAFKFDIFFRLTNASPEDYGTSWSVNGTNTFSALNVFSEWPGSATAGNAVNYNTINYHQTYDGGFIPGQTQALATNAFAKATITGVITVTSDGVFSARSYTEANGLLVILAGSSAEYLVTA